jgi:precorrin-2/cobalt-factor-2 C20-methyltransferase
LARDIVEKVIGNGKSFIEIEFPMTKNKEDLRNKYNNAAQMIYEKVRDGAKGAYLTIGDPLLYSTYIYLLKALKKIAPEIKIETIPGISAYSALASRLNFSLAEKDERICICPAPQSMNVLKQVIENNDTIVIMKVAKKLPEVIHLLKEMDLFENTVFGSHVGMENEKLFSFKESLPALSDKAGYLSTIIVRKNKE